MEKFDLKVDVTIEAEDPRCARSELNMLLYDMTQASHYTPSRRKVLKFYVEE